MVEIFLRHSGPILSYLYWGELTEVGIFTKDGSDIHRLSNRKRVSAMCTVGNLSISGTFLNWKNSNVDRLSSI